MQWRGDASGEGSYKGELGKDGAVHWVKEMQVGRGKIKGGYVRGRKWCGVFRPGRRSVQLQYLFPIRISPGTCHGNKRFSCCEIMCYGDNSQYFILLHMLHFSCCYSLLLSKPASDDVLVSYHDSNDLKTNTRTRNNNISNNDKSHNANHSLRPHKAAH